MKEQISLPSQNRLKELFLYDPATGIFVRRNAAGRHNCHPAGEIVGCQKPDGYLCIRVDGRLYQSHRLAWVYVYGVEPVFHIDHVDRVKNNNRIANLREADKSQNGMNRGPMKRNQTGLKGVGPDGRGGFRAQIRVRGKSYFLGRYKTPEEAHAAYVRAANKHFGGFAFEARA